MTDPIKSTQINQKVAGVKPQAQIAINKQDPLDKKKKTESKAVTVSKKSISSQVKVDYGQKVNPLISSDDIGDSDFGNNEEMISAYSTRLKIPLDRLNKVIKQANKDDLEKIFNKELKDLNIEQNEKHHKLLNLLRQTHSSRNKLTEVKKTIVETKKSVQKYTERLSDMKTTLGLYAKKSFAKSQGEDTSDIQKEIVNQIKKTDRDFTSNSELDKRIETQVAIDATNITVRSNRLEQIADEINEKIDIKTDELVSEIDKQLENSKRSPEELKILEEAKAEIEKADTPEARQEIIESLVEKGKITINEETGEIDVDVTDEDIGQEVVDKLLKDDTKKKLLPILGKEFFNSFMGKSAATQLFTRMKN